MSKSTQKNKLFNNLRGKETLLLKVALKTLNLMILTSPI